MTPNDFLRIIQQATNPVDEIPAGWYSVKDLSKMWKIGVSRAQRKIKEGKNLGYVTEKKFLVKRGKLMRVPYYRFHEKENNQKDNKRQNMENPIRLRRKD